MILNEFRAIASHALAGHEGLTSLRVLGVRPGARGPEVLWEGLRLSPHRERRALGVLGPPAGPLLLELLAGTLAARWEDGAPHCPKDWDVQLARRHRRVFGKFGPGTGPGWCWLWEAGAQTIERRGVPRNFRTTDTKEKYGTLRWDVEADENCSDAEEVTDAAEHLSALICENCGAPGRIRQGGWLKCRCDRCDRRGRPT